MASLVLLFPLQLLLLYTDSTSAGARKPLIKNLPSSAFTATSFHANCPTSNARSTSGGAWCPANNDEGQYLEIDLGRCFYIDAVSSFPRKDATFQYVKQYKLSYSEDRANWYDYPTQLNGPQSEGEQEVIYELGIEISAQYLRFTPSEEYNDWKSMRVEAYIGESQCPAGFTYCETVQGWCEIPPYNKYIRTGYLSYGRNGRFSFMPFSNDNKVITIACNGNLGDIYPFVVKTCCYMHIKINIPSWYDWTSQIIDATAFGYRYGFHYEGMWMQRYGANGRFVYRFFKNAIAYCNEAYFSDPIYGVIKYCRYNKESDRIPSMLRTSSEWTACGKEGGECKGLSSSSYYWIIYGTLTGSYSYMDDDGRTQYWFIEDKDEPKKYHFRLVQANDGSVPCNNAFFDDPYIGKQKFCYRTNAMEHLWVGMSPIKPNRYYNLHLLLGVLAVILCIYITYLSCYFPQRTLIKI